MGSQRQIVLEYTDIQRNLYVMDMLRPSILVLFGIIGGTGNKNNSRNKQKFTESAKE